MSSSQLLSLALYHVTSIIIEYLYMYVYITSYLYILPPNLSFHFICTQICFSLPLLHLTFLLSAFLRLASSIIFFIFFLAVHLLLASLFLPFLPITLIMKLLSCANMQRLPQLSDYKFMEPARLNKTQFFSSGSPTSI